MKRLRTKRFRNGRKKVYRKQNRTIKNKKMIGGFNTEKSIIEALQKSGQYERWRISGGKFGLIIPGRSSTFQYEDFRGDTVYVNEVSSKYRDGVINIAVFKQITKSKHITKSKPITKTNYGISKAPIKPIKKPYDLDAQFSNFSISGSKKPYS
jgi:hypothetical protein